MPTTTMNNQKRGQEEKNRRGKLVKKGSSFHGSRSIDGASKGEKQGVALRRPRTVPDLITGKQVAGVWWPEGRVKMTKLLLNVTVQRSLGTVHVVMSQEATVGELIAAAIRQYVKEGRRPVLALTETDGFDLHYSQFSLQSLDREEKLMALGSRNFFVWPKKSANESGGSVNVDGVTPLSPTCSRQADQATKTTLPNWLKFMDFLL